MSGTDSLFCGSLTIKSRKGSRQGRLPFQASLKLTFATGPRPVFEECNTYEKSKLTS